MSGPRIIAGAYRGRALSAPSGLRTRPTSGRVREAIFGILGDVSGAHVLDLYAGTGALAIEALSRGAGSALLVEHDRGALVCIRRNLALVGEENRARVLAVRVAALVPLLRDESFDLVLCDPPWDALEGASAELGRLAAAGRFARGARIALEHAARSGEPNVPGLVAYDRRKWGDTAVSLFQSG